MADEQAQAEQDPTAEAEQPDYKALYEQAKAHSREWERKAKANRGAAEEIERLRSSQMGDLSHANQRSRDANRNAHRHDSPATRRLVAHGAVERLSAGTQLVDDPEAKVVSGHLDGVRQTLAPSSTLDAKRPGDD